MIYAVLIFHFSSESNPLPAITSLIWDKALHAAEYGGLGFLLCRAVRGEGAGWRGSIAVAILITGAYGASDEWHQLFVPGRDSNILDWVADTIGAVIGSTAYKVLAALMS